MLERSAFRVGLIQVGGSSVCFVKMACTVLIIVVAIAGPAASEPPNLPPTYTRTYRVLTWTRNQQMSKVPNPTPLCTRFTWIRIHPQMLVYKRDIHCSGRFCDIKTCFLFLFQLSTFWAEKTTQKHLQLKDWSKSDLVPSIGVNTPK